MGDYLAELRRKHGKVKVSIHAAAPETEKFLVTEVREALKKAREANANVAPVGLLFERAAEAEKGGYKQKVVGISAQHAGMVLKTAFDDLYPGNFDITVESKGGFDGAVRIAQKINLRIPGLG